MKQYYVHGTVDDCRGHWAAWFNCLKQKTKFKDEVLQLALLLPMAACRGDRECALTLQVSSKAGCRGEPDTWVVAPLQVPDVAQLPTHPIWKLRGKEEAQEFWQQEFGHLSSEEADEGNSPGTTSDRGFV
jgi:ketosteroid isomerase-like protein